MGFNQENWAEVLDSLGFTECKNPNGKDCYDVLNEKGIPVWQYETEDAKEKLYYFFSGMIYQRIRRETIRMDKIQEIYKEMVDYRDKNGILDIDNWIGVLGQILADEEDE